MIKAIGIKADLSSKDYSEYYNFVSELIEDKTVQSMQGYIQHGTTTCYQHCINVSYYNYRICTKFRLDACSAARAGILHDLFLYDWHSYKRQKGEKLHGFTHPTRAFENASKFFDINDKESDMIIKHMFPLTLSLPKYKETFVIVFVDKYCSILETVIPRMTSIGHKVKRLPYATAGFALKFASVFIGLFKEL